MEKAIKVATKNTETLLYTELSEFQGELKSLSTQNYEKLKAEILELDFSYAIHYWADKGKNNILDGHQRVRTVKTMVEDEGYTCPPLPVVKVEAKNFKEAKKKVLAGTSQFGVVETQGLYEFMNVAGIKVQELDRVRMPEINIALFKQSYFEDNETVEDESKEWDGMPEYDHKDKTSFRDIIVHFFDQEGVNKFAELMKQTISDKTRMLWYPMIKIDRMVDKGYNGKE